MTLIRIATRNSPLALWQANYVKDRLLEAHAELQVDIVGMTTKGDQLLDRSLAAVGGKGLFLKELEISLLNSETDIAVHSMKDVPVEMPDGLTIAAVCERGDARDALVSNDYQNLYALHKGARVGTSSLRRVSQLKNAFPALEFLELRGNVNTRLAKLDNGEYDAIILAAAGLIRLGFEDRIKQYITPELCLPAVGQGIVGVQCRVDDAQTRELLEPLHNRTSELCLSAEREMNAQLEGGCQVPIAGYAELVRGKIFLRGVVGKIDGSKVLSTSVTSPDISIENAKKIGRTASRALLKQGAGEILAGLYADGSNSKHTKPKGIVLLTRQPNYLGNMADILESLDYHPMHVATLDIRANDNSSELETLKNLKGYTDIVFVSRNAVEAGMQMLQKLGGFPAGVRALAVGAETAKQLYRFGVDAMFPHHGSGAEALLKVSQLIDLSGRRMLILRGDSSLSWPEEVMRERGAEVDIVEVYRQAIPEESSDKLNAILAQEREIHGVFAHSAQSVINLVAIAGENVDSLLDSTLVAGSSRIAATASEYGWRGEVRIAESPSNKHMMIAFSG